MRARRRIAFIGNSLPRRCGIATFTTDLHTAIASVDPMAEIAVVAIESPGEAIAYSAPVIATIRQDVLQDYVDAAGRLNSAGYDLVCLQHEFGIFGGAAGAHVLALLSRLMMPVVTTLHTVLETPDADQHRVMDQLLDLSSGIVVMAEKARDLLRRNHAVPPQKIEVIPHGVPEFPFGGSEAFKAELGFGTSPLILTFGLLSPNKGLEVMIEAMPEVLRRRPDAVYLVLGATHPALIRREGEAYRDRLVARARELGVDRHVVFDNRFVDQPTLLRFIAACDVYVTPYLHEQQMTSGTLAYSFGLGKAVVSTPYWHARELLAEGRGVLVPFGDAAAIGEAIGGLVADPVRREAIERRAYAESRSMTWPPTARRYLATFDAARRQHLRITRQFDQAVAARTSRTPPEPCFDHFLAMCDDTGLFQHAVHSVPDRAHGYCIDDNARALLLMCDVAKAGEAVPSDALATRFASFIQHAWNPDRQRFRNFMGFDRRWLEDVGSEDSHGRTLWALGTVARDDANPARRAWARRLFAAAFPAVAGFGSPRAHAFTLLGLNGYCAAAPGDDAAGQLRQTLGQGLFERLAACRSPDWVWFEEGLSYDNARLPQALISAGAACGHPDWVADGLAALRWLMQRQTAPSGRFRPVGTEGFFDHGKGRKREAPKLFDQQPVEAAATIAACRAALAVDPRAEWRSEAIRVFAWFLGCNDLSLPLADPETGGCLDGLHPDRANENQGAESILAWLMSLVEIRLMVNGSMPAGVHRGERVSITEVHAAHS